MQDVFFLDRLEQAAVLLKPQRIDVLRQLAEPRTCTEVAAVLQQTPQRVYYNVKQLVKAELAIQVAERRVRGINEGVYEAVAHSYWLSPALVGAIGHPRVQDELSFGYLLSLVEEVQSDIAALSRAGTELPSVGISGEVTIRPEHRAAFLRDLRGTLQELMTRYGGADGDSFRLAVACYPKRRNDG